MSIFRQMGRRVEQFKQRVKDAESAATDGRCPECDARLEPDETTCPECGHRIVTVE